MRLSLAFLAIAVLTAAGARQERAGADEIARLKAELAAERAEVARLSSALDRANERRSERELEWYEYNQAVALFDLDRFIPLFAIDPEYAPATVEPAAALTATEELEQALAERAGEIRISLRHLLRIEEIRGLDLLEVGLLGRGAVGPVIFRLLDDRGRLAGGLSAERLRLEASVAGHTVTLVLENGFESRGGERVPFRGGARRIALPYVDPRPWMDSCPELFPVGKIDALVDDGRWRRERVKSELNRLLRETAGNAGYWRLRHLDGVLGGELTGVHVESFAASGRLERRLFADRMTIARDGGAIRLRLEDGVILRAGERSAFIDGTYRIYLPGARAEEWEAAKLPGLSEPPVR